MNLIGTWAVDAADRRALADLGDVLLEFSNDGRLNYTIRSQDKDQVIKLRYRVEDNTIITDQPSVPRVERTQFSFSSDGALTLAFGGTSYRFRRPR